MNSMTLDEQHEWDVAAMRVKLALTRLGRSIPITCADSDYSFQSQKTVVCKKNNKQNRKTICLDTLEVYDSAGEAGRAFGGASTQISAVCRGKLKSYKGHRFAYYDDYVADTIPGYTGQQRRK